MVDEATSVPIIYLNITMLIFLWIQVVAVNSAGHLHGLNWQHIAHLNRELPDSINIFTLKTTASPFGTPLSGSYVRLNMNDTSLQLVARGLQEGSQAQRPFYFIQRESAHVVAAINGGYFDNATGFSLLARDGRVINKNKVNENEKSHPTLGTIASTSQGKVQIQYAYSYEPNYRTYKFSLPNPISGPVPSPSDGKIWEIRQGVGAGPILIRKGSIVQGNPQNFNVSEHLNKRHPRSAVCLDEHNSLYFLAINGRVQGSAGVNLLELSQIMQNLGCWDALNMDGGGSSFLYANGQLINHPSDKQGPRRMVTTLLVVDRSRGSRK